MFISKFKDYFPLGLSLLLLLLSAYFAYRTSVGHAKKIVFWVGLIGVINAYAFVGDWRHSIKIVLAIDIVIVMCAAYASRNLIYNIGYDTWMHLALIRRGLSEGLFPSDPYYLHYRTPPHYSLVNIIHTALAFITRLQPHRLWGIASPFFLIFIGVATYGWVKELTQDAKTGLLATVFALGTISGTWHYATYPRNVAPIFYALAHLFYFRSLRMRGDGAEGEISEPKISFSLFGARKISLRNITLSGVFFGLSITTHLFTGVVCLVSLLSYAALKFIVDVTRGHSLRRIFSNLQLTYIPLGFIVASPWLLLYGYQFIAREATSPSHYVMTHQDQIVGTIGGIKLLSYKGDLFWGAYPGVLWYLAGFGALVCLYRVIKYPAVGFSQKQHPVSGERSFPYSQRSISYAPALFLITTSIAPTLILLTPLYMLSTKMFGAWMTPRFMSLLPVPILAALGIRHLLRYLSAGFRGMRKLFFRLAIAGCALIGLFIILLPSVMVQQVDLSKRQDSVVTPLNGWDEDFAKLKPDIQGKVVLSDIWTSYFLPYYTGAYVVGIPPAHGAPFIDHEKRVADVATILNPSTPSDSVMALLRKYEVDYVLLNLRPQLNKGFSKYGLISGQYPEGVA